MKEVDLPDGWYHWNNPDRNHLFLEVRDKQFGRMFNLGVCPGFIYDGQEYRYPSLKDLPDVFEGRPVQHGQGNLHCNVIGLGIEDNPPVEQFEPHWEYWTDKPGVPEYIDILSYLSRPGSMEIVRADAEVLVAFHTSKEPYGPIQREQSLLYLLD